MKSRVRTIFVLAAAAALGACKRIEPPLVELRGSGSLGAVQSDGKAVDYREPVIPLTGTAA